MEIPLDEKLSIYLSVTPGVQRIELSKDSEEIIKKGNTYYLIDQLMAGLSFKLFKK